MAGKNSATNPASNTRSAKSKLLAKSRSDSTDSLVAASSAETSLDSAVTSVGDGLKGLDSSLQAVLGPLISKITLLESEVNDLKLRLTESEKRNDLLAQQLGQTDQYHRRSTVIVTGLAVRDNETIESLATTVSSVLSQKSKVPITPADIQAVHRNSPPKDSPPDPNNGASTPPHPPSITLRLYNYNTKDKLLKSFSTKNRGSKIRVVQSLSPYYQDLRRKISLHCKEIGLKLRYIHYRSPSAGLVLKTDRGAHDFFLSKIFCWSDFVNQLPVIPPSSAVPSASTPSADVPSAGNPSAGNPSAGVPSAGTHSAGTHSAGAPPAGAQPGTSD